MPEPSITVPPRVIRSNRGAWICAVTRTQRRAKVTKADTRVRRASGQRRRETPRESVTQACRQLLPIAIFLSVLCPLLCPCPRRPRGEGFHDLVCFEALSREVTVQPLKLLVVRDRVATAQTLVECGLDQRVVVYRTEDV